MEVALNFGVEVALNWAAQAGPNCIVGMYNDTAAADGGFATPFYEIVKEINRPRPLESFYNIHYNI